MHDQENADLNTEQESELELEDRGDEVGDLPPEDDDLLAEELQTPEPEEPVPAKSKTVPHARFNEVNEQYKAERETRLRLEEEIARLRGTQQPPKQADSQPGEQQQQQADFDFKDARRRLREAIYEGDDSLAEQLEAEIDEQMDLKQVRIAEQRAQELLEQRASEQQQKDAQKAVQTVVAEAYETYPFLDIASPEASQDAIDEVVALRDLYISRGKSAAQAIAEAVAKIGPRYSDAQPRKQDRSSAIEQNLERERRIPPAMPGVGERARKMDYSVLSDDEFEKLPEAEKRKARGDFVA